MYIVDIKILDSRLGSIFPSLKYETSGSCGLDLRAMLVDKITVCTNTVFLIPTGISIFISNPLITAVILPRSGLGHNHGIILGNTIGLIDSDYQGQLMVSMWNRSVNNFVISPGDRIAQLVFFPIIKPIFNIVSDFKYTKRNVGGFGHTNV